MSVATFPVRGLLTPYDGPLRKRVKRAVDLTLKDAEF